ncbi:MAG: hypothetical protein OJF50_003194 [Nitrospira sp.]|nr:hypothetical protein [Nitrospira sp.]
MCFYRAGSFSRSSALATVNPCRLAALAIGRLAFQEVNHQRHATLGHPPVNGFWVIQMPSSSPSVNWTPA